MPANLSAVRRLAFFSIAALTMGGCADMLGLGGLTYDQGQELDPGETGGSGAESTAGTGGLLLPTGGNDGLGGAPYEDADFPRQVPRDALIAAAPPHSGAPRYWIYSEGALGSYVLDPAVPDLIASTAWNTEESIDSLTVTPGAGGYSLLGYGRSSGFVSRLFESETSNSVSLLADDYGTSGRSHLLPFFNGTEWLTFVSSSPLGSYRYFRPLPSMEPDVYSGMMEEGWTSFASFAAGDDYGVLKHHAGTGKLVFDRFVETGQPLEPVAEFNEPGSLMSTFSKGDDWGIVMYQTGTGNVETFGMIEVEGEFALVSWEQGVWRGDLTVITPLDSPSSPQALTFSQSSGVLDVNSLYPLQQDGLVVR